MTTEKVRVHTGVAKKTWARISAISKQTGVTKEHIINAALERGLPKAKTK